MTQDACPQRDDREVICPTGLWGLRAIVEEPLNSTYGAAPAPPIGVRGDLGVSYLAADLSDGPRLADMLAQVGISQVETFEELIDSFQRKSDRLGLIYLDSRHEDDGYTGARGIAIGREMLTGMSFDALRLIWPGRPLVVVTSRRRGDHSLTEPFILINEFRRAGAAGVVMTECTLWGPAAGQLSEQVLSALVDGAEIGPVLLELRRSLLVEHNSAVGFAYRLLALGDTKVTLGGVVAAIDADVAS